MVAATRPITSVCWSVSLWVCQSHFYFFNGNGLYCPCPNHDCSCPIHHCPCPTACDRGCRLYNLVKIYTTKKQKGLKMTVCTHGISNHSARHQHALGMASVWYQHSISMASARQQHSISMATVCTKHGISIASALRQCDISKTTTWQQHGNSTASVWY